MADQTSDRTRGGGLWARGWRRLVRKLALDRRWQAGLVLTAALMVGVLAYLVRTSAPARVDVIAVWGGGPGEATAPAPAGGPSPAEGAPAAGEMSPAGAAALAALRQHSRLLTTVVVPACFLDATGQVETASEVPEVERLARSQGLRVWARARGRDGAALAEMLLRPSALEEGAENLARAVTRAGYDGVALDPGPLEPRHSGGLARFVSLLRQGLPPLTTLAVCVPPKVEVPPEAQGGYDYAALGRTADYLVLLAFDLHRAAGAPGPVSPFGWATEGVKYALSHGVPGRRLVLAAAAHGYDWPLDGSPGRPLAARLALDLARQQGVSPDFDPESRNPFFFYGPPGERRLVWYQDRVVARERVRLVKAFGLHGVALWGLGQEDPATWAEVQSELSRHPTAPLPRPPAPEARRQAA